MARAVLSVAVVACLLAAPAAHAAGHAITLSDPRESSCSGAGCTPDITSLAIYFDTEGSIFVSTTFAEALPAYNAVGATRVRVSLGRRLTIDGSSCTPTGTAGQLSGENGDIRIEIGAYDGGVSGSSAANGVLYRVGSPIALATTRGVSVDRKTITVTISDPALVGLDVHCTQADVADDADVGAAVRDAVQFSWFPGLETTPPGGGSGTGGTGGTGGSGGTGGTPATGTPRAVGATGAAVAPAAQQAPAVVTALVVGGTRKVASVLTCRVGHWKHATKLTVRWFRERHRIARASTRRYTVRAADRGHILRCRVTATNAKGRKVVASRSVRIA